MKKLTILALLLLLSIGVKAAQVHFGCWNGISYLVKVDDNGNFMRGSAYRTTGCYPNSHTVIYPLQVYTDPAGNSTDGNVESYLNSSFFLSQTDLSDTEAQALKGYMEQTPLSGRIYVCTYNLRSDIASWLLSE